MEIKEYGTWKIAFYGPEENIEAVGLLHGIDYIKAETAPFDCGRIESLISKGFHFHDRTIMADISLVEFPNNLEKYMRFPVVLEETSCRDEILEISKEAFMRDRRFHLDIPYNSKMSHEIMKGYIDELVRQDSMVFVCRNRDASMGFAMVKDMGGGRCEIKLGAVKQAYRSKGAAMGLYSYLVAYLSEAGYKKLYGHISTNNATSLNLHIALGAALKTGQDIYIRSGQ